ncbi:DUF6625 family protein [Dyadobacter sp. 676]|uniref:DUF6625 family protein n=1 Tax=Dyadobacter sp. 676 TaxID=3088362 RepID=A0AAU8FMM7_9BACT
MVSGLVKCNTVVIVPYFGELPWYFWYFIKSCENNPDFHFLLIGDSFDAVDCPANVMIVPMNLNELAELICTKLGFPVQLSKAYKLCDFKPAYGLIFSDFIADYQFWAQSDIDVIFGKLSSFLTPDFLSQYDYVSVRHDYTSGCFSVFRNLDWVNRLFMLSKDYEMVYQSPGNYCFDQCNYTMDYLTNGGDLFKKFTEIESFTHVVRKEQAGERIRAHFDFILIEGLPGRIKYDRGRLIYQNRFEAILYHLYHFKRVYFPARKPAIIPKRFRISVSRIYC